MTLFDRYLLQRFFSVFLIMFCSTFGLFMVIDGFTNVDEFQRDSQSAVQAFGRMTEYYLYQSSVFFELVGPILSVVTVMVVFALLRKHAEIAPVLAAGIPTYRLAWPFIIGTLFVSGALAANQELIIPRIAHKLQAPRKAQEEHGQKVEPIYDRNRIHIDGKELYLASRTLRQGKFVLPAPNLSLELTAINCAEAVYVEESDTLPAGWLLRSPEPTYEQLTLTDEGRQVVREVSDPNHLFICTTASYDQLYNRNKSFKMVSTPELLKRIRNPSTGMISVQSQLLHFHSRLTRPFMSIVFVLVIIPMIIRRDSRGLIGNMAVCTGVLGTLFTLASAFHYLGSTSLISADQATWAPIVLGSATAALLSRFVQT